MDLDSLSLSQIIHEYQSVFQSKKRKAFLEKELNSQKYILGSLQESVA